VTFRRKDFELLSGFVMMINDCRLYQMTHAVKKAGARVAVQLAHGGAGSSSAVTGVQLWLPHPSGA